MGVTSSPAATARSNAASQLVLSHAIATVVKAIDDKILALPGSRDRLLPAIEHAITYYQGAIAAIPGPVGVSANRHGTEPVLTAMFPSVHDITVGLGRSIAVRNSINWFVENQHDKVFAIMGTRQRPGNTESGLTDHTFRSLAASEQDARECLCEAAFTSQVNAFASRLKERQREWHQRHPDQQLVFTDPKTAAAATPPASDPSPRQQEILARYLNPNSDTLSVAEALEALIEWLHAPEALLRIDNSDPQHPAANLGGHLHMPTMSSNDRRRWLVCLAEFQLQEALGAITQTPAANRYILI